MYGRDGEWHGGGVETSLALLPECEVAVQKGTLGSYTSFSKPDVQFVPPNADLVVMTHQVCDSFNTGRCRVNSRFTAGSNYASAATFGSSTSENGGRCPSPHGGFSVLAPDDLLFVSPRWKWQSGCWSGCHAGFKGIEAVRRTSALGVRSWFQLTPEGAPSSGGGDGHGGVTVNVLDADYVFLGIINGFTETFEGQLYQYSATTSLTYVSTMYTLPWPTILETTYAPEPTFSEGVHYTSLLIRDGLTLASFVMRRNDTWNDPEDPSTARSYGVFMQWATRTAVGVYDFVPDGDAIQINQFSRGTQVVRDAVTLSDDPSPLWVVVWDSDIGFGEDTSGATVVGRVYDGAGLPFSDEFVLPTSAYTGGDQVFVVASRGPTETSFFAAWLDKFGSSGRIVVAVFSVGLGPDVPGVPLPFRPSPPVVVSDSGTGYAPGIAFRSVDDGHGPDLVAVVSVSANGAFWLTRCSDSDTLVLDAGTCSSLGATPFSLDSCLTAALALPSTAAGHVVQLASGTWGSCPPGGVAISKAIRLVGAGPTSTIVDCNGAGRAFVVEGSGLAGSGSGDYVLAIASMSIRNGRTDPGVTGGPSGGCIALRSTLDVSTTIYLQDLVVSNCTVGGGTGGGGVYVLDVGTLNINSCTFRDNSVVVDDAPGAISPFPALYGGGLLVESSDSIPAVPAGAALGLHVSNTAFVGNVLSAPISGVAGLGSERVGGAGAAVVGVDRTMVRVFFTNVTFAANVMSHGYGAGLLVRGTDVPVTLGPGVDFVDNSAGFLGSGGALSVVDMFDELVWVDSVCRGNRVAPPITDEEKSVVESQTDAGSGGCASFLRDSAPHASLSLSGVAAEGNEAAKSGGGLFVREMSVSLDNRVVVSTNTAVDGGGVYFSSSVEGSEASLSVSASSVVVANSASRFGGGIAMTGGVVDVYGSLESNYAGYVGGGVFVGAPAVPGGVVIHLGSVVTGNRARVTGSGVFECIASRWCGAPDAVVSGELCISVGPGGGSRRVSGAGMGGVSGNDQSGGSREWASDGVVLTPVESEPLPIANASVFSSSLFADNKYGRSVEHVAFELRDAFGDLPGHPATLVFVSGSSDPSALLDVVDGECELETEKNGEIPGVAVASSVATSARCGFETLRVFGASLSAIGSTFDANFVVVADAACVSTQATSIRLLPCLDYHQMVRTPEGRYLCEGRCGVGEYVVKVGSVDTCEPCPEGTYNPKEEHSQTSCVPCVHGTYAYGGADVCKPCPRGGVCTGGGSRIEAKSGYWYAPGHAEDKLDIPAFISCTPSEACPGGPDYSACTGPYHDSSFLCSKCAEDHAWAGTQCVACWPLWVNILMSGFILVVAGAFVASILRAMLASGASMAMQVVKVVISYLQILSLVVALEFQQSRVLTNVLGLPASFANASPSFFSFACISQYSFRTVFFIALLTPAIAVATAMGIAAFVSRIGSSERANARAGTVLRVIIMSLFLVYPGLTREMLTVLHCRYFSELGSWRLVADLDITCWTGEHRGLVVAGVAGVAAYAIGIPATGLYVLARARHKEEFAAQYAFFVTGYRESTWYWEVVVAARKSAIVVVVVFVASPASQLGLGLMVLLLSLMTHAMTSPFKDTRINTLDASAHVALVFTTLTALFVGTHAHGGVDGDWKDYLVVAAICVNFLFVSSAAVLFFVSVAHRRRRRGVDVPDKYRGGARGGARDGGDWGGSDDDDDDDEEEADVVEMSMFDSSG